MATTNCEVMTGHMGGCVDRWCDSFEMYQTGVLNVVLSVHVWPAWSPWKRLCLESEYNHVIAFALFCFSCTQRYFSLPDLHEPGISSLGFLPGPYRTLLYITLLWQVMGFCRRCGDIVAGPRCKCGGAAVCTPMLPAYYNNRS